MKYTRYITLALALVSGASAITINRNQASAIYGALAGSRPDGQPNIGPGLSLTNVVAAADDINLLTPVVTAYDKAKLAAQHKIQLLPKSEDRDAKAQAILDDLNAIGATEITIDLEPLSLTPQEAVDCKMTPATLSCIYLYLKPATASSAKK
jgi:hypothetical protein